MATCGRLRLLDQGFRFFPIRTIQRFSSSGTFKADDLICQFTKRPGQKPINAEDCAFGKYFTDHMLAVSWDQRTGWGRPIIKPLENLSLHPATSVFHYSTELFEGMKAYRSPINNSISLFRPYENMERMTRSAIRAALPTFDHDELMKCISELIRADQDWVPYSEKSSLYLRPTMIGTEPSLGVTMSRSALLYVILSPTGPYFGKGLNSVSLLADPKYKRAGAGMSGAYKLGSNYGPTIRVQELAKKHGCHQVLWLYGDEHEITEVGTMNLFIYWINEEGENELVTMGLDKGLVLPGVTRSSMLALAREWNEFKVSERTVTMGQLQKAASENRVMEMFGAGTAAVVCPVDRIHYMDEDIMIPTMEHGAPLATRLKEELHDIQYGKVEHEWAYNVLPGDSETETINLRSQ